MNICFMAHFAMIPHLGGIQRVTTLLSRELSRRGHNILYLCYAKYSKDLINDPAIEFPQFYIDCSDQNVKEKMRQFIAEKKINCLVSQEQDETSVKLLALLPETVKIVSVHHTTPFIYHNATRKRIWREFPSNTLRIALHKMAAMTWPTGFVNYVVNKERSIYYKTLKHSDKFVFLTKRFFPRILYYIPDFPQEKLIAINNPNSFDVTCPIDYEAKKNIVLWVGRVDPNKNCKGFLKAWRFFSENHPDWSAVVAGDGPELVKCKQWVKTHNLKNITFLGYCNNIAKLYIDAKIFVSTSFTEGWPMTLNEAMSKGCIPCVYNTFESLTDIVEDGVNGVICKPDPKDLALKLENLSANKNRMLEMTNAARMSLAQFDVCVICNQWEDLLNNLVRRNNNEWILD